MEYFRKNRFLLWNLIALVFIKAVFSFSSFQLANIIDGVSPFSKEDVVSQTNVLRSNLGFSTLKSSPTLESVAWQKLQDMINGQYFAHTSPSGTSPWYWFDLGGYKYTYAGENLAIGFVDAKTTIDAWANSPSHRANLLNPNYKEIGIAVAPAKINDNSGYLVVQLFGTPKPTPKVAVAPAATPKPTSSPVVTPRPAIKPATTEMPLPTPAIIPILPATIDDEVTGFKTVLEKPITLEIAAPSPKLQSTARSLNFAFILYSLTASLALVIVITFRGIPRQLAIQTTTSFAVFALAIAIPVLEITKIALIV